MTKRDTELAIYISAIMLVIGVFLPLIEIPLYGKVTYNKVAEIESYLVILFAISAPALLFTNKVKLLIIPPLAIWTILLFPAIKNTLEPKDDGLLTQFTDSATSALSEVAGDLFLNITEFSWGGLVFVLGLLLFTVSCIIRLVKFR